MERLRTNVVTRPFVLSYDVLWPLLVGDLIVAIVYGLHVRWHVFANRRWDVSLEGSWGEWYGHAIEAALVIGLAVRWWRYRQPIYAAWAALFLYVGIDDTAQLHERFGSHFFHDMNSRGLRGQDIGELGSWLIAGIVFFVLLRWAHRRSGEVARAHSVQLTFALGLLIFCGAFLDQADRFLPDSMPIFEQLAVVPEDVGELVALSFALASVAAFLHFRRPVLER